MRSTTAIAQRALVGIARVALTLAAARAQASHIAPLNYFLHAAGPAAAPTMRLGWAMAAISVTVTVVIAGLLIAAIVRKRPAAASDSLDAEAGGMRWIYIGTGVSSVALLAMLVYVLITLESVATPATHPQLSITVTAYDWWWKVDYADDPNPARNFSTANEIHIPVGEPVKIALKSADVVHAFWVPQLAGKTQTIPGQTNEQWFQADRAGIYRGQCSQFCGAQHAHMAFEVVAQSPADFSAWRDAQGRPAVAATDSSVAAGRRLFAERCAGCHTIRGTDADGLQAPDLTHLNSRRLIAAGAVTNTPDHLLDWIQHAQSIKPEALMPSIALSAGDAAALSAYLATLH
ncbi:cytochrome c oxidase subunit 2 [Paraburkholderia sp. BL18I3N2]|uniref:cytochrome c oxidase subunit II n=1 Tax=Paraburkholderia sp. BL18I3N2 TaxID=1938799 RepID=UPI000D067DF3|nr:cytochrome c oxidase subunit II [Paraburkholderia sp. BL18I3N2]PRX31326.1 cytochrome c oxidase subunit 2 [Paraburkholderia sp. BL18I3N2]